MRQAGAWPDMDKEDHPKEDAGTKDPGSVSWSQRWGKPWHMRERERIQVPTTHLAPHQQGEGAETGPHFLHLHPGYPFGGSAYAPLQAGILGSSKGLPGHLLAQPPPQATPLPELHLDPLRREICFPPEGPLGAGTLRSQTPILMHWDHPTTGVAQRCVLLFKKTKRFILGIASWEWKIERK